MGNLLHTESKSYNGPFVLDESSLEGLDQILNQIVGKLDDGLQAAIEENAEGILESQRESGKSVFSMDKARQVVRERTLFKRKETSVELVSADDTRLKDSSLGSLLKDPKAGLINPIELNIILQRGPCEFRLHVAPGGDDEGDMTIEVFCKNDSIAADIWHLIKGWADKSKENIIVTWFSKLVTLVWLVLGLALLIMLVDDFSEDSVSSKEQYNSALIDSSRSLLQNGIDSSEVIPSLSLILQLQSGYIPNDYTAKVSPAPGLQKETMLVGISLLISIGIPRTTIGLGRRRLLAKLYKYWVAIVVAWLPTAIILPWLLEKLW